MKPFSTISVTAKFAALLTVTLGLAVGAGGTAHAQDAGPSASGATSKSTGAVKGPPCGGSEALTCPGGMECADDPADSCDPTQGGLNCKGVCVAGTPVGKVKQPCGGPNAIRCSAGMQCIDDPSDNCDPTQDGLDCRGHCAAGALVGGVKPPCGGPAAIRCAGGMVCVDDPSDNCDPTKDGLDCKGFCAVEP